MNVFQLKKFKKMYHSHTAHIDSFNFKYTPVELKNTLSAEEFEQLQSIPLLRIEETRSLLLNEAADGWHGILEMLKPLDELPDMVLWDLYSHYEKRFKGNVTAKNIVTFNDEETVRRSIYCLLPELLWTRGDNKLKSRIFCD